MAAEVFSITYQLLLHSHRLIILILQVVVALIIMDIIIVLVKRLETAQINPDRVLDVHPLEINDTQLIP